MNVFTSIDWHPSLNDVIDHEFIDLKRLEDDSAMYNLMHGSHSDPLKNVYRDYYHSIKHEDIEFVKKKAIKNSIKLKISATDDQNVVDEVTDSSKNLKFNLKPLKKTYIPGIKRFCQFPRKSNLSIAQHALCLRVLLKFSQSDKPNNLTAQEANDLQTYLSLKNIINQEQDEVLHIAKQIWEPSSLKIVREDLINLKWQEKLKNVQSLHKHYGEVETIAINSDQNIQVNFNRTVLQTGTIPILISIKPRYIFNVNTPWIKETLFSEAKLKKQNHIIQDVNCKNLARSYSVDMVLPLSALKCLATNLSHNSTWILPITVEEHNSTKITFIDKPLPNTAKNVIEKNSWIYKYILKNSLLRPNPPTTTLVTGEKKNSKNAQSSNSLENLEEETESNFQYNIYTIGACGTSQNELMKNKIEKDYKILVRTKIDASQKLENGVVGCVKLVPKLEHQTAFGAEAVTLEEAARQWISLTFTPDTYVIRVRIDQPTSEYLQIEKRTASSINNELNRLYNVKGDNILAFIYNIIKTMEKMNPGRYLLRHTPRDGAFTNLYKEIDVPGRNSINLDSIFCEDLYRTIPNAPWPVLDKTLPTPVAKHFHRIPVTFYPKISNETEAKISVKQKKKKIIKSVKKKKRLKIIQSTENTSELSSERKNDPCL